MSYNYDTKSQPILSGYTTTYQALQRGYPLAACINSLLGFCDEVVVVDAGSQDGTCELLEKFSQQYSNFRWYTEYVDYNHPRWAVHIDGYLKAKARKLCTGKYCWQTDSDEVVPESDYTKVRSTIDAIGDDFNRCPVVFLPMVEFWGSFQSIRADFFSWKPRLSLNDKRITHGVPTNLACVDQNGFSYPRPFDSDSCNYIYLDSGESAGMGIPVNVPTYDTADPNYQRWYFEMLNLLPSVYHVSWLNLPRKIEHYRTFWPSFHSSMYNLPLPESAADNVMFDKPWSEVTASDIQAKAKELVEIGPRSFHSKINYNITGQTFAFNRPIPQTLLSWYHDQFSGEAGRV